MARLFFVHARGDQVWHTTSHAPFLAARCHWARRLLRPGIQATEAARRLAANQLRPRHGRVRAPSSRPLQLPALPNSRRDERDARLRRASLRARAPHEPTASEMHERWRGAATLARRTSGRPGSCEASRTPYMCRRRDARVRGAGRLQGRSSLPRRWQRLRRLRLRAGTATCQHTCYRARCPGRVERSGRSRFASALIPSQTERKAEKCRPAAFGAGT